MLHSFDSSAPIILKEGSSKVPYTFTFVAASSSTANDGSIPYGTTIDSATVTILGKDGTSRTSEILESSSATSLVVSVSLKYPATTGAGQYSIRILLVLSSTAVMEFAFDQLFAEETSFINYDDLKLEMSIDSPQDEDLLKSVGKAVEAMWDMLTNKVWYLTSYSEQKNGSGSSQLFLDNYPITALDYITEGSTGAATVKNTNSSTYATVSVTSTSIILNYNGSESTLLLATYDTITKVVDQINSIGSGWAAVLLSTFGDHLSSSIFPQLGQNCIASREIDLNIPDQFKYDFEVNAATGELYSSTGFFKGFNNIVVKYSAGYTNITLPNHIKQLLIRQASHWYRQAKGKNWDYTRIDKIEGGTVDFSKTKEWNLLPDFVKSAAMNRRLNV